MSEVTLLFLNTHRLPLNLESIPPTVPLLKKYLIENWSTNYNNQETPNEIPTNIEQLRFIHLGKQLSTESISSLNLGLSDVIHVSTKPASAMLNTSTKSAVKKIRRPSEILTKREQQNNTIEGESANTTTANNNTSSNQAERSGGGCCVIV